VNTAGETPTVDFILLKNNYYYYCTERSKSCTKERPKKGGPSKAKENKLSQRDQEREEKLFFWNRKI
jgi:hypothetical protein